jgi:hypothetical protein
VSIGARCASVYLAGDQCVSDHQPARCRRWMVGGDRDRSGQPICSHGIGGSAVSPERSRTKRSTCRARWPRPHDRRHSVPPRRTEPLATVRAHAGLIGIWLVAASIAGVGRLPRCNSRRMEHRGTTRFNAGRLEQAPRRRVASGSQNPLRARRRSADARSIAPEDGTGNDRAESNAEFGRLLAHQQQSHRRCKWPYRPHRGSQLARHGEPFFRAGRTRSLSA